MSLLVNCLALNYILSCRIFGCQVLSMVPVYIKEGRARELKKEEVIVNWVDLIISNSVCVKLQPMQSTSCRDYVL